MLTDAFPNIALSFDLFPKTPQSFTLTSLKKNFSIYSFLKTAHIFLKIGKRLKKVPSSIIF